MNSLLFQVCLVSTWVAGLWAVTDRRLSQTQHKTPADRLLSQKTTYYYQDASSSDPLRLPSSDNKGFIVSRESPTNGKSSVTSLESILEQIKLKYDSKNLKTIREHIEKLFDSPKIVSAKFLELKKKSDSNFLKRLWDGPGIIKHLWDGPDVITSSFLNKNKKKITLTYITVAKNVPGRWPRIKIVLAEDGEFPEADSLKDALLDISKITFPERWITDAIDHLKLVKTKQVIFQLSSRELPGTAPKEEALGFVESVEGQFHKDLVFKGPDVKNGFFVNYITDEDGDRELPQIAEIKDASGTILWIRNTDPKDLTQKIVMKKMKTTQVVLDESELAKIIAPLIRQSSDKVSLETISDLKTQMSKEEEFGWTTIKTPGWPVKSKKKIIV